MRVGVKASCVCVQVDIEGVRVSLEGTLVGLENTRVGVEGSSGVERMRGVSKGEVTVGDNYW